MVDSPTPGVGIQPLTARTLAATPPDQFSGTDRNRVSIQVMARSALPPTVTGITEPL